MEKEEELKSVSKFFALLLKSVAVSEPRAQWKSFIAGKKLKRSLLISNIF